VAGLVALASCAGHPNVPHGTFGHGSLVIRTDAEPVRISVRVATSAASQAQGLMGQRRLPDEAGMAFTYAHPTAAPFWMKDTTIPLSIAFWNGAGRIVDMLDMDPCTAEPCPLYRAKSEFVGAVEVNQGFFDRHEVVVGDTVELSVLGSL
jgi:uncharacterized membrane protein (UPF0127 family)